MKQVFTLTFKNNIKKILLNLLKYFLLFFKFKKKTVFEKEAKSAVRQWRLYKVGFCFGCAIILFKRSYTFKVLLVICYSQKAGCPN